MPRPMLHATLLLLSAGLLPQPAVQPARRSAALGVTRVVGVTPLLQQVDADANETIVEASRATPGASAAAVVNVSVRAARRESDSQVLGAPLARLVLSWSSANWPRMLFATGFVCGFASVLVGPHPASFSIPGAIAGAWQWGINVVLLAWALARLALARLLVWLTSGFVVDVVA